ncbi:MAG: bifunctional proline dehydrogenase/L-glutamate gamma-semialdehyde dehydrogenase PutA [Pseudomonadota bacterium]
MRTDLRESIRRAALADEAKIVAELTEMAGLTAAERTAITKRAADLVRSVRASSEPKIMEAMLAEYGLSTQEGVALMCLAEALLRVPDAETIDDLIQDKIAPHDWGSHIGDSGSLLVNASTWALLLTGRVLDDDEDHSVVGALRSVVRRLGEPVIRTAVGRAMKEMGAQFVLGRDIHEAMARGAAEVARGYTYSYDMLGEAAKTEADAARYHGAYAQAIAAIARQANADNVRDNPGISVKLSALHPRYEFVQRERTLPDITARALQLVQAARTAGMGLNIDAEEADRLDLSLDVITAILASDALDGWDGFGVVVQAYGQRAPYVIDWLHAAAEHHDRKVMVRLVKGAYWDTEIKRAQVLGLDGFPVLTRKTHTDISFIACARKLLSMRDRLYPQFATHNAHTIASVLELAGSDTDSFEFQRLHGMGEALHETVRQEIGCHTRIYAPVGAHRDLLAYLVRRLLENGANSSFVNQIVDETVSAETIAKDPFATADGSPHPAVVHPSAIYGSARRNARGWDVNDPIDIAHIEERRAAFAAPYRWSAGRSDGMARDICNPANSSDVVGIVFEASADEAGQAVEVALAGQPGWAATPVAERAAILNRVADLYEIHAYEFFALATREAGKVLLDGIAEVREAVDFLRYYAYEALRVEANTAPRGVIVCISPWNFPLAIFTGQIAAALVTGNAVIAKPAEQTPMIAARAISLMHDAGVPEDALQLVAGDGPSVGAPLTADPRIAGVCFTGSTEVAKLIDRQLATTAPDAMLIAETGGLNAMIVDSTALPEQAVRDIIASAFQSAGQRCSALRMLYVQRDVEERLLDMLFGAIDALAIDDPWHLWTDMGPVIDHAARHDIMAYCDRMEAQGRLLKQAQVSQDDGRSNLFVPPTVLRVGGISELAREVFGPVLHVARFDPSQLDQVIADINRKGYGLTFGLHTRIDRRVQDLVDDLNVGNLYVNRNQIGAIVGSQPFGGEGLSGTGPKAGGPHYLSRFRRGPLPTADGCQPVRTPNVSGNQLRDEIAALNGADWAERRGRVTALRAALRGKGATAMAAAAALDAGPVDLPGPTGESNRYALAPRGVIVCLGPTADAALDQAIQALRTGNSVIAVIPDAKAALAPLVNGAFPLRAIDGHVAPSALEALDIAGVAYVGGQPELRRALAERCGPIIPLISERFDPAAYAHERAVCIDTTAAGGNATLLGEAD